MDDDITAEPNDEIPYRPLDQLDFSLITSGMKWLHFFEHENRDRFILAASLMAWR